MIRLEDADDTHWGRNFNKHVSRKARWLDYRQWHITRTALLAAYGGKVSRAGGKISFVFEDDKHASMFILKWS